MKFIGKLMLGIARLIVLVLVYYFWGGVMQLAWNELTTLMPHPKLVGGDFFHESVDMVRTFDLSSLFKKDLDDNSSYVKSTSFGDDRDMLRLGPVDKLDPNDCRRYSLQECGNHKHCYITGRSSGHCGVFTDVFYPTYCNNVRSPAEISCSDIQEMGECRQRDDCKVLQIPKDCGDGIKDSVSYCVSK